MKSANQKTRSAQVSEMVEYQAGAFVSRELLKKKTGTVTLFAFDEGQGLSEHTAPFDAMVCVLDGEAEISIAGKPRVCSRSDRRGAP